jgi:hypothetical protein
MRHASCCLPDSCPPDHVRGHFWNGRIWVLRLGTRSRLLRLNVPPFCTSQSHVCSPGFGSMFFASSCPKRPRSSAATPSSPQRQKRACSTPASPPPPHHTPLPDRCSECGLSGGNMNVTPPLASVMLRAISHVISCLQCAPKSSCLLWRAHASAVLRHVPRQLPGIVDVPPPLHTGAEAAVEIPLHRLYCCRNARGRRFFWRVAGVRQPAHPSSSQE